MRAALVLAETVEELHKAMKWDFQLVAGFIAFCTIVIVLCVRGDR